MSKRTRANPISSSQRQKLESTYVVIWYNCTQTYSEAFKLSSSLFSTYSAQSRLLWRVGSSIVIQEKSEKYSATILAIGDIVKVNEFTKKLDFEICDGYATEDAILLAEAFEKDDEEDELDSDQDYSPHNQSTETVSSEENELNQATNKRIRFIERESEKVRALQRADVATIGSTSGNVGESIRPVQRLAKSNLVLPSGNASENVRAVQKHPISSLGSSSSNDSERVRIVQRNVNSSLGSPSSANTLPRQMSFAAAASSPAASSPSNQACSFGDSMASINADETVRNEPNGAVINEDMLSSKVVERLDKLIKLAEDHKKILKVISCNTDPVQEIDTDLKLPAYSGGEFRIDEVVCDVPTQFALQIVDRMMGPSYIKDHRFEQRISEDTRATLADSNVIQLIKKALRARFGRLYWNSVRNSLNQASRDRYNREQRKSGNQN